MRLQSGIVPIKVGVPVVGDVTVAVWFGSYNLGQRLHSRPALAFAFHTAFTDAGSVRITADQLDLADPALVPPESAKNFFIDVILTQQTEVCGTIPKSGPAARTGPKRTKCIRGHAKKTLLSSWQLQSMKLHGTNYWKAQSETLSADCQSACLDWFASFSWARSPLSG